MQTTKTKELENTLKEERSFSKDQIINAEKIFTKWLHFIVAETGYGKISCFIDKGKNTIDINPTPFVRITKD